MNKQPLNNNSPPHVGSTYFLLYKYKMKFVGKFMKKVGAGRYFNSPFAFDLEQVFEL